MHLWASEIGRRFTSTKHLARAGSNQGSLEIVKGARVEVVGHGTKVRTA